MVDPLLPGEGPSRFFSRFPPAPPQIINGCSLWAGDPAVVYGLVYILGCVWLATVQQQLYSYVIGLC